MIELCPLKCRTASLLGALAVVSTFAIPPSASAADADLVARGKYLAQVGGCEACHTVPASPPFGGGRYIDTAVGSIASSNITASATQGIGKVSDDDFYRALHDGIGTRGQRLYPAMPFQQYTIVTRDDALAIKAYLLSVPESPRTHAYSHLEFPYTVRASLVEWRTRNFAPRLFAPDAQQSAEVNRGDYLVNGLGHCATCHRPAAPRSDDPYALPPAPDMRAGTAAWSVAQLATYLRTNAVPDSKPRITAPHDLAALTEADAQAMAQYLKTVPAAPSPAAAPYAHAGVPGAQAYLDHCAACHGQEGKGLANAVPSLVDNAAVRAADPAAALAAVLGGRVATANWAPMPAVGAGMTDAQVADAVDHVRKAFGNATSAATTADLVAAARATINTPMNPATSAACTPLTAGGIAQSVNQPLSGIIPGIATMNEGIYWLRIDTLALRAQRYLPDTPIAEQVNVFTGIYCRSQPIAKDTDRAALALKLGRFGDLLHARLQSDVH